jgi:iron complex transport system substrate-binding protein
MQRIDAGVYRSGGCMTGLARLLLAWALLWGTCVQAAASATVLDDRGAVVQLLPVPQRIVSLLPSLTESVCALGQCGKLVGVDRYSNYPASVRALASVGGGLDPNIEAIVALKPDLVLVATSAPGTERLRALGLRVVALEPKDYASAVRVLGTLGQLLGVDTAKAVVQTMEADMRAAVAQVPNSARGKRVYFEVSPGPYAASSASFLGQTLERLGLQNIVSGSLGPFPKVNPEWVVRAQPDVILVGDSNADEMPSRPGWASLSALQARRVCVFHKDEADVLVRAGPRMAQGAMLVARCLQTIYGSAPVPTSTKVGAP